MNIFLLLSKAYKWFFLKKKKKKKSYFNLIYI